MASPNEIMKTWPHYRVAAQKASTDDVQIRDIRCPNITELREFLQRIYCVADINDLAFVEIHELMPGGMVAMVQESDKPWPKNVKETKVPGLLCPKIPREEDAINKTVVALVETATTVVAGVSGPDETSRPTILYTIEVA